MPESPVQFGGPNTERDAEILRQKLRAARLGAQDLLGIPSTSVIGDDARRGKLEHASEEVAKLVALIAAVGAVVPGLPGKIIASVIAGVEKVGPGEIKVVPGTATNFLPSPFGFMDPNAVGLKRNFYLTPGITRHLPDDIVPNKLGFPQQQREDETADAAAQLARRRAAAREVAGLSDEDLAVLIERRTSIGPAGRLRASQIAGDRELVAAATVERQLRAAGQGGEGSIIDAVLGQLRPALRTGLVSPTDRPLPGEDIVLTALFALARFMAANPPDP